MLIRLADRLIEIKHPHPYTEELCRDYTASEREGNPAPDINITVTQEDIDLERIKSDRECLNEGRPVEYFSDDYLESLAVYRKISERMPEYDTFLFHGSAVAVDGEGYVFTAKSGTGKSTHAGLWQELLGDRFKYVNDDKPLIRAGAGSPLVYGTPWSGKHGLNSNISVPIKAVCILERGEDNRIIKIDKDEAMPVLIRQSYRPYEPAALAKTLTLLDTMALNVGFYRMQCNMEPEAARTAYERMSV